MHASILEQSLKAASTEGSRDQIKDEPPSGSSTPSLIRRISNLQVSADLWQGLSNDYHWTENGLFASLFEKLLRRLAYITDDFHIGVDVNLSDANILDDDADFLGHRTTTDEKEHLLLGHFTQAQAEEIVLSNKPLINKLAEAGFTCPRVILDFSDAPAQKILIRDQGQHVLAPAISNPTPNYVNVRLLEGRINDQKEGLLLMELALRRINSLESLKGVSGPHLDARTEEFLADLSRTPDFGLVAVEWLLLQNPTKTFDRGVQPLPGQVYPGLGMGKIVSGLINDIAKEIKCDGTVNAPLYYHNAVLYAMHGLIFINPEFEGIFNTLGADMLRYITNPDVGLAIVSRAIFAGRLFHITSGKRVKWVPGQTQIWPMSQRTRKKMRSLWFGDIRDSFTTSGVFRLDLNDAGFVSEQDWEDAVPLHSIDTRQGSHSGKIESEYCRVS